MGLIDLLSKWRCSTPRRCNSVKYNADDDPLIQERREIDRRTTKVVRDVETRRHPATGLTLADMAANRFKVQDGNYRY